MVKNRNNHKQQDQIRIFHLHDSSVLVSVILEIRKKRTYSFCLAPSSSIFTVTPCIRLPSTTDPADPVPASAYIKSTEIHQKINSTAPASSLLCIPESWRRDPQASLSLWFLGRPQELSSDRSNRGKKHGHHKLDLQPCYRSW